MYLGSPSYAGGNRRYGRENIRARRVGIAVIGIAVRKASP
jgi:hypothetical protein